MALSPEWSHVWGNGLYFQVASLTQMWFLFLLKSLPFLYALGSGPPSSFVFSSQQAQRLVQATTENSVKTFASAADPPSWNLPLSVIFLNSVTKQELGARDKSKSSFYNSCSQKGCLNQPKGVSGFYKYWLLNLLLKYSAWSDVV